MCLAFQIWLHRNPGFLQWYRRPQCLFSRDSLPLHSSSLKRHWWWWQMVNWCRWPVHSPLTISSSPRTLITLLMASLSHLFCCSILLTLHALNTPSAVSTKHPALLLLTPSHTPNLHLGFILFTGSEDIGLASTFSPNGTNSCVGFLPCNLSSGVRPSRPFWHLPRMFHQPRQDRGVFPEFFLCAALHMTLDGSDDTAQEHHCVLDQSV